MPHSTRRRRISTNYRRRRLPESALAISPMGQTLQHYTSANTLAAFYKKHIHPQVVHAMTDFADKAKRRPKGRPMVRGAKGKLKVSGRVKGKPVRKGKAGSRQSPGDLKQDSQTRSRTGDGFGKPHQVVHTHPRHKQPKWKLKRHREYKNLVYQTILISRPARLANSENCLIKHRHATKFPESNNFDTQTVILKPFCSEWSGIHTMHYQHVNAVGDALTNSVNLGVDGRFDVIQHKAPSQKKTFDASIGLDGQYLSTAQYQHDASGGGFSWNFINSTSNNDNVFAHLDNMVKTIDFNLEFISARPYVVDASVSLVRFIKETTKFELTTEDIKNLTNSVSKQRGLDYDRMVVEFQHKFSIPALQMNKKIPSVSFRKKVMCSFMQKNDFETRDVAGVMTESNNTGLGKGIIVNKKQIADGNEIGNFAILISYKKRKTIQQFTYEQSLAEAYNAAGYSGASIRLPVVTEESFDVPTLGSAINTDGLVGGSQDGAPLSTNQGNEAAASFFCQGKITTAFAFKDKVDQYPSVTNTDPGQPKKPLSLNLSHFITGGTPVTGDATSVSSSGHSLYCRSVDHEELP